MTVVFAGRNNHYPSLRKWPIPVINLLTGKMLDGVAVRQQSDKELESLAWAMHVHLVPRR